MSWWEKKLEYENRMARARGKKLDTLKTCTICGADKAKACQGCGTTAYCSTDCQRIDWRDRGHRKVCKKIQAAEAARAEAPTRAPSPPVFYGPAPRSHADEVRARIAAEHEAARARREENPEREPLSARLGSRCPICLEEWDVNATNVFRSCCCRRVCRSCQDKIGTGACPLCRLPCAKNNAENLARLRRHVENDVPEAIFHLGAAYRSVNKASTLPGIPKNDKKAAKLCKRAVELGYADAMCSLSVMYMHGEGVKRNKNKAIQLMRMAADRGVAEAQKMIAGAFHEAGDAKEAVRYLTLAGEQGLTEAELQLGRLYAAGADGVEVDFQEAKRWFARAAAKGDEEAKRNLARNAHIFGA